VVSSLIISCFQDSEKERGTSASFLLLHLAG
jgi:hypothetical protein